MFDCYFYWFCVPTKTSLFDSPKRKCAFEIDIEFPETGFYSVALVCDNDERPEFVRVKIPNLPHEIFPEWADPDLNLIKNHMSAAIRSTYDLNFCYADYPDIYNFVHAGHGPDLALQLDYEDRKIFIPEKVKGVFVHTLPFREVLALYMDGGDARIPLQYRYLSLYKIIELNYSSSRKWDFDSLNPFLEPFSKEFLALGFAKNLFTTLIEIRDKCAHIRTGTGDRQKLGVTQLNHREAKLVRKLLPLLQSIAEAVLNSKLDGRATFEVPF
jgi:hypothetical protein